MNRKEWVSIDVGEEEGSVIKVREYFIRRNDIKKLIKELEEKKVKA